MVSFAKKLCILYTIAFCPFSALSAYQKEQGITREFRKHQEESLSGTRYEEATARKKMLHRNLINAMRGIILRRSYHKKEKYYKALSIENIAYENPNSTLVYYTRFKDFTARLEFELDPKLYLQQPKHVKLILLPKKTKQ